MAPVPPPVSYYTSSDPPRPVPPPNSHRRHQSVSSSSTGSARTDTTSIKPSRVAQLRNLFSRRRDSANSSSTVPEIQIEPPSRPESAETVAATTAGPQFRDLPPVSGAQVADPVVHRRQHPGTPVGRPPSRTGFMYGAPQPQQQQGGGNAGYMPPPPVPQTPGTAIGHGLPNGMSFGDPPPVDPAGLPRSGSAADYFFGQHHAPGPSQGRTRGRGHRREPSDGTITDPNAYYDPETDPEYDDTDDTYGQSETPRAVAGGRNGSVYAGGGGEPMGYQRPPSRSAGGAGGHGGYDHNTPASAAAMAATRRAEASGAGGRGPRTRKVSVAGSGSGHTGTRSSTSRTPLGNTPFVRSSGLYVDEE